MVERVANWGDTAAQLNVYELAKNPYPGRFIALGVSPSGEEAVQVYGVMGRSDDSRNRVLSIDGDTVETEAFNPAKVKDPSLIIYNAMRVVRLEQDSTSGTEFHVVSNGHQTDAVARAFDSAHGRSVFRTRDDAKPVFAEALTTGTFEEARELNITSFEPDDPNFTPRITGYLAVKQPEDQYGWAITKRDPITGTPLHTFGGGPLQHIPDGKGLAFHTYDGDAKPLPSFSGEPYPVTFHGEDAEQTAKAYWEHTFDKANRVAIAVKYINRTTGIVDLKIINALQPEVSGDAEKKQRLIAYMLDDTSPITADMPSDVAESIDRERQVLAMRAGWADMPIGELEGIYRGGADKKLPYVDAS